MKHNSETITSTLIEERRFAPPKAFAARAQLRDPAVAQALRASAAADPDAYWRHAAREELRWSKPFTQVRDVSFRAEDFRIKWYADGEVKSRHLLTRGDLVIANTDLTQTRDILGRPVMNPYERATSTHHTFQVRVPEGDAVRFWIYAALRQEHVRQRLISYATGTTVAALPLDALLTQEVPWATKAAMETWWKVAEPLFYSRLELIEEIEQLALTRDEMLPLLFSGRARIQAAAA